MTDTIRVFDNFLPHPVEYRADALGLGFRSFDFEHCSFHGIALAPLAGLVPAKIRRLFPEASPTLSFFRKSPSGQQEPHFIHTDADMGDWSAILYLNPDPPPGDGTLFYIHEATGATASAIAHERSEEGRSSDGWLLRYTVESKFNRLLVFPSTSFHSRAIYDNWGVGDEARLTQVTFGTIL